MAEGPLVAVDFDKTLTDPDQDEWGDAFDQEPNSDVIEAVREEYFDGKKVIIWTARQWSEAAQIAGCLQLTKSRSTAFSAERAVLKSTSMTRQSVPLSSSVTRRSCGLSQSSKLENDR